MPVWSAAGHGSFEACTGPGFANESGNLSRLRPLDAPWWTEAKNPRPEGLFHPGTVEGRWLRGPLSTGSYPCYHTPQSTSWFV